MHLTTSRILTLAVLASTVLAGMSVWAARGPSTERATPDRAAVLGTTDRGRYESAGRAPQETPLLQVIEFEAIGQVFGGMITARTDAGRGPVRLDDHYLLPAYLTGEAQDQVDRYLRDLADDGHELRIDEGAQIIAGVGAIAIDRDHASAMACVLDPSIVIETKTRDVVQDGNVTRLFELELEFTTDFAGAWKISQIEEVGSWVGEKGCIEDPTDFPY